MKYMLSAVGTALMALIWRYLVWPWLDEIPEGRPRYTSRLTSDGRLVIYRNGEVFAVERRMEQASVDTDGNAL